MTSKPLDILLVEDSPGDARLTAEALQSTGMPHRLTVSSTAEDALEYVFRCGRHSSARCPDLVLLDLNLPDASGHEVLRQMKSRAETRSIPVIILSGSQENRDVDDAYNLHANCYVNKPSEVDELFRMVQVLQSFWSNVAQRPPARA